MNYLLKLVLAVSLLGATAGLADVKQGKKFYMKKMKSRLDNMNGMKFVSIHTADEWKELFDDDAEGFKAEFSEKYPKIGKVLSSKKFAKYSHHVRDFAVAFASDSGNVLSCSD